MTHTNKPSYNGGSFYKGHLMRQQSHREAFIREFASQHALPRKVVRLVLRQYFAALRDKLKQDGNVRIAELGAFDVRPPIDRIHFINDYVSQPRLNRVAFTAYKELRQAVSDET